MLVMKSKVSGFTLLEMMMVVALLGILASVAVPSFRGMLMNSQVRNATESVVNGLQKARAEAVKRNTNVEFVVGADTSWQVKLAGATGAQIESRSSSEGSVNVTRTTLPGAATTITFTNLGGIAVANADASAVLTQVDLAATGADRSLRVTVGAGGNIRMCDPNLAAGSNPRAC